MDALLERLVAWASDRQDIRAAVVIGSYARADRPADEWSDLDIVLIASDPERYLSTAEWLRQFGDPWLTFVEPTPVGNLRERRVLYAGALDVDFTVMTPGLLPQMVQDSAAAEILRRGMRVLLDKDGEVEAARRAVPPRESALPDPPTLSTFTDTVHDFWYHAVWTAKKLRRGELMTAKTCCDGYMKQLLLLMLEWQARARHGRTYDTWFRGRFLEDWADRQTLTQLGEAFAHYQADDVRRALFGTMGLFRSLATDVAGRLGYRYPAVADRQASGWVTTTLQPPG